MRLRVLGALAPLMMLAIAAPLAARQNILLNGSLERGLGRGAIDPQTAATWLEFGLNVERSAQYNLVPAGAGHSLKAFGDGDSSSAGASQEILNVTPGQSVTASVKLYTAANDKLGGTGNAGLVLEFLNQFGGINSSQSVFVLDANSPADTWITATIGPINAPSTPLPTARVRIICRLQWTIGDVHGACWWDDAQVTVNGGPNRAVNGDFETAGINPGQSPYGIDDWVGFENQEKVTDVAYDGVSSVRIGTNRPYSGLYQSTRALDAGERLLMIGRVWNPSAAPLTANSRFGLKLEWSANSEAPPPVENLAFDESVPVNTWTDVTLSETVPADVSRARIVCIFAGDTLTSGHVYYDLVSAERSSAPGDNQLFNASFEDGTGGANGLPPWVEFGTTTATTQKACATEGIDVFDEFCVARSMGPSITGLYQEIAVAPGETLSVLAHMFTPAAAPLTGPGRAGLKIEWRLGTVPEVVDIGGANNTIDASAPTDTWIPLYIDYTMPAGTNAIARYVNLMERGTASSGRVYADGCEAVIVNRFDGADWDGDDDEDLRDYAALQACFADSGNSYGWNCTVFDADEDNDLDISDWNFFRPRLTSPN